MFYLTELLSNAEMLIFRFQWEVKRNRRLLWKSYVALMAAVCFAVLLGMWCIKMPNNSILLTRHVLFSSPVCVFIVVADRNSTCLYKKKELSQKIYDPIHISNLSHNPAFCSYLCQLVCFMLIIKQHLVLSSFPWRSLAPDQTLLLSYISLLLKNRNGVVSFPLWLSRCKYDLCFYSTEI